MWEAADLSGLVDEFFVFRSQEQWWMPNISIFLKIAPPAAHQNSRFSPLLILA
jgi:hypothetical protein